jgi:hypothetical protein
MRTVKEKLKAKNPDRVDTVIRNVILVLVAIKPTTFGVGPG